MQSLSQCAKGLLAFSLVLAMGQMSPAEGRAPQGGAQAKRQPEPDSPPSAADIGISPLPADYVIGPEDVLGIIFWREKDVSADVVVRPDGRISLPLLNDIQAAGLTPDGLRAVLAERAR